MTRLEVSQLEATLGAFGVLWVRVDQGDPTGEGEPPTVTCYSVPPESVQVVRPRPGGEGITW